MLNIRTILHPTDFSEYSDYAFHLACALARDYNAKLLVIHVMPTPADVYGEFGTMPPEPGEEVPALKQRLEALVAHDSKVDIERHLVEGEADSEIIRVAEERGVDLIVLGTHGRTGLGRLLMGSVAEQVVRLASCPVLSVKKPIPEVEEENS